MWSVSQRASSSVCAPAGQATASDARAAGSRAAGPAGLADLIDCRSEADPDACLGHLGTEEPEAQVWSEAIRLPGAVARGELVPGPVLVIWTLPPDHGILRRALDQVRPERLYLFAVDPQVDACEAFVRRLASAGGPTARRLLLGQLRPRLQPQLEARGLAWEDDGCALPVRPSS